MSRWIVLISLAAIALVIGGYLLAVLVPRDADEPEGQLPTFTATQTIPPAEP